MIIGLDLDGTTGDYADALLTNLALQSGVEDQDAFKLAKGKPLTYAMNNWFKDREEFVKVHTTAVDNGLYRDIQVFPDASDVLWRLSDEGHDIHIVTSRFVGHRRNNKVVSDTAYWLDANSIPYRSLHFVRDKFLLKCDVFIEDSPENIVLLREEGRDVIVYDAPYNQGIDGRRAHTWREVETHIREIESLRQKA